MTWTTIAEGSTQDLRSTGVVEQLPHGTEFRITIDLPWYLPIAPIFDVVGAEWVADRFFNETHAILEDVEGVGAHRIVMHMRANAFWVVPATLAAVALILIAAGIIVAVIKIDANIIGPAIQVATWLIPVVAIGGLVLGAAYLVTRR